MSSKSRIFRLGGVTLLMFALAMSMWIAGPAFSARPNSGGAASGVAQANGSGNVSTASDNAASLISPSLRERSGTVNITVYHNISSKAALLAIAPQLKTRAYVMPDGSTLSIGKVDAKVLVKLASVAGVQAVTENGDKKPSVIGPDGPVAKRPISPTKLNATAKAKGIKPTNANINKLVPTAPTDWNDVGDIHNARQAWANGYDGTGITVAVLDSGVDFGHPDMQGTYATINGGPYAGWGYDYDDYSTAYWELFAEANTPDNWTFGSQSLFIDTSETVTVGSGVATTATITVPLFDRSGTVDRVYQMPTNSKSGVVHVGFHPDAALGAGWMADGGQPAIVVVDPNTAGVYDTVYVDLDDDQNFNNDIPMSKTSPLATLDWTGDNVADESAGLLFWIADGTHANPGSYIWSNDPLVAGKGDLVAFMYVNSFDSAGGEHGGLCSSNVVAQGVASGPTDVFGNPVPAYKPAGTGGMVWGTANKAKVAFMRGVYLLNGGGIDGDLYAALGADGVPGTGDEAQVSSHSYGSSAVQSAGFDAESRQEDQINYSINPNLVMTWSAGNDAEGYATDGGPFPHTAIIVGASTQYGSTTDFEAISNTNQINWGDTMSWSSRAPSGTGRAIDVNAEGAWGAGDYPLNEVGDGEAAWEVWGGTSKASPTAAGVTALVVGAFLSEHGRLPTYAEAKHIVMSSANDNGHDVYLQGAGVVDALRATNAAAAAGGIIANPSALQPGSFDGVHYGQGDAFSNILTPGASASEVVSVTNASSAASSVTMKATMLQASQVITIGLSSNTDTESGYDSRRPDYQARLFNPADIPADAAMMTVQLVYPYEQFEPGLNYSTNTAADQNIFRILAYDWTDLNDNGKLWTDANGNGAINAGELDALEYNRFSYGYNYYDVNQVTVGHPRQRVHDGLLIGVIHRNKQASVPSANLTVRITFYKEVPWNWISLGAASTTIAANGTYGLNVTTHVPNGTPIGMYEGTIHITPTGGATSPKAGVFGEGTTQIPVSIVVAADSASFTFGGHGRSNTPYDNNVVWGYNGAEYVGGDGRIYDANVPASDAGPGKFWLVNTSWYNYAVPTDTIPSDIDTRLFGPVASSLSNGNPARYGPYTLGPKGASANTQVAPGIWAFNTATGTTEEWVSGDLSAGLNQINLHNVTFSGQQVDEPFVGKSGVLSVSPYPVSVSQTCGVNINVQVSSTLPITPVTVLAFGLSQTVTSTQPITLNTYTDYSFTLDNPAVMDVKTRSGGANPASDVDLYVYHIVNGQAVPVGQSTGSTADEEVRQVRPAPGEYLVRMYGYASPTNGTVLLVLNNIDGTQLSVVSAPAGLNAGQSATIQLATTGNLAPGDYNGAVLLGPNAAPGAAFIPITVHVTGDCPTATPEPTQTLTPTPVPSPTPCPGEPYTDVNTPDYFHLAVNWLYCRGATDALPEGSTTFQPYQNASRAVIVKMAVLGNGFPIDTSGGQHFTDVPTTNPYYDYIMTAWHRGIISGYNTNPPCGANSPCFLPNDNVTRGQIAKIVVKAQAWTVINPATPTFADVPTSYPFYTVIETLYAHYAITGYDCGTSDNEPCGAGNQPYYRPGNPATRGQVAKIVFLAVTTPPRK